MDALPLDEVDYVRTALLHLIDSFDVQSGLFQHVCRPCCRHQFESHIDKTTRYVGHLRLVVLRHTDEDRALGRQFLSGRDLSLGEGFAEVVGHAHNLAGGTHLGTEHRVDSRELAPREYRRLHVVAAAGIEVGAALDVFGKKFAQLATRHQAGCDLGHGHARGFRNVRHRAGGARIDFKDVDRAAFGAIAFRSAVRRAWDGELNIHQSDDFQSTRQLEGVFAHALQQGLGDIDRGQHARRVARVDAGFLDVLHDAGDDNVFAVGESVDIDFNSVFEEVVDEDGTVLRVFDCFFHVAADGVFVVGDDHGASTEHIGGTDQHGISDAFGAFNGFFQGGRHGTGRLGNLKFIEQLAEALTIFRQVNRLGRGANDGYPRGFQGKGEVQGRLPAKLHDHPNGRSARSFVFVDGEDIFERQRLEV